MNNNVDRQEEGNVFALIMVIIVFLGLIITPMFKAMSRDNSEYLARQQAQRELMEKLTDSIWDETAKAYLEVYGEETAAE